MKNPQPYSCHYLGTRTNSSQNISNARLSGKGGGFWHFQRKHSSWSSESAQHLQSSTGGEAFSQAQEGEKGLFPALTCLQTHVRPDIKS